MWKPQLSQGPVRARAIVDALEADIARGSLRPGDRLPPQRILADWFEVNLSTISRAYGEATRRRLIGGEIGRGTFVLGTGLETADDAPLPAAIDLSAARPSERRIDNDFADTVAMLSAAERQAAAGYVTPKQVEEARRAIRRWLEWRGLSRSPETVVPCPGARIALMGVLVGRCAPGDAVLVERDSFPALRAIAGQLGLRLVPVDQDREGVVPEAFAAAARRTGARTAVLVANLQSPTGSVMGPSRRAAIAEIVAGHDLVVVEDDVYGSLSGAPPLMEVLGPRGILVSSLSKTVMPGLRFGFAAGPAAFLKTMTSEAHPSSWGLAALPLMIGTRWIEDGTAMRRDTWQRHEVEARWAIFRDIFGPSDAHPAPQAWLRVDGEVDAAVRRAREAGVEIAPSTLFHTSRKPSRRVRIGLGMPATRKILRIALTRLRPLGFHI